MKHYSVLLKESLELLNLKSDGIYVDGTLGLGGHSQKILENLKDGCLYAFDKDEAAIQLAKERLKDFKNVTYIHDNFANMARYLDKKVDGILLDLGVSSMQFDEEERGFSYRFDARLDMRMDKSQSLFNRLDEFEGRCDHSFFDNTLSNLVGVGFFPIIF